MKRPSLAGSARNADFWRSAVTSIAKPASHTTTPTIVSASMSCGESVVSATRPAARVRNTHSPCSVHVIRNCSGLVLMRSKRPSLPSLRIRRNRNEPSRAAHTHTRTAMMVARASRPSLPMSATAVTVM